MTGAPLPILGVAIVAFNSADVILACLDSLLGSTDVRLRVAVTDNSSTDTTAADVRAWAEGLARRRGDFSFEERGEGDDSPPRATVTLIRSGVNRGYAGGVNAALALLARDSAIALFWVLNPDCEVPPEAAARYAAHGADGAFALMSGRTLYRDPPNRIQTDGGRVNRWTGVCSSANAGRDPATTAMPEAGALDFLTGANIVASRRFLERAGPMVEDYFLYYEEVDWAYRRGDLPLRVVEDVTVFHHGGTTIGSGTATRRATPFANFFNYRNRVRFQRRHNPAAVPVTLLHAVAKAAQLAIQGARDEAMGIVRGAFGLAPPRAVAERIADGEARRLAFGHHAR